MNKYNTTWGKEGTGLKYEYENENNLYNSEVKNISMSKEEFKKYMKELELKNKYKNKYKGV